MTTPDDATGLSRAALERIATVLLALSLVGLGLALFAGWGWRQAATGPVDPARLTEVQRQALVQHLIDLSPGIHQWSWYEPRLGYTYAPDAEIEAWGLTFRTNALGFRAPPPRKDDDVYRVLFVGDSWTFGMGIQAEDSYPYVTAELANARGAAEALGKARIEAWPLALPGWSGYSQLSALAYYADLLEPDAVVLAPSSNDVESTAAVLPNGSLWSHYLDADPLGSPHGASFGTGPYASHEFLRRWRVLFERLDATAERLESRGVPTVVYFVARWPDYFAHHWMESTDFETPFGVVPIRLTLGEWRNPPPAGHGTPAANRLYAEGAYELLARRLDWPRQKLPAEMDDFQFHEGPVAGFSAKFMDLARRRTRDRLSESYRPPIESRAAKVGAIDPDGTVGRATTLLVLRAAGASNVLLDVECLSGYPFLYPLGLRASIPAEGGGTSESFVINETTCRHTFSVPIPRSVRPGDALDLQLVAQRAAATRGLKRGVSYRLLGVRQE